jgi:ATP-dependent Clp protease ATP-binding subunit ClpA
MFNIPLALLNTSKATQIQTLHTKLNSKIFGQQPAIEAISTTLTHSYIMHTNKTPSPQASFLFCGPSGVGKTKTAEEIAKLLGRGFSVINMNEYQNEIDVQKLTGAAPGYIGYESGGQLTNIIAQNPYSVLLFDEFEKAHKNVQRLLLQILDKGTFTDNQGTTLSFNNTIIIMATNAGVQRDAKIGFDEQKTKLSVSHNNLSKVFLPEFLGRVNQIVTFEPLSQSALQQITNTLCHELNATIEQDYNISISVNPAVQDFVIKKGYRPELGARIIKNTFQREVEVPVAYEITANHKTLADTKKRAQMTVDLINNKVVCKTIQK